MAFSLRRGPLPQGPAVESSIAVEDAAENRSLYRVLFRACFEWMDWKFNHNRVVELPRWFRTRRLRSPACVWMRDRTRQGPPYRRGVLIAVDGVKQR